MLVSENIFPTIYKFYACFAKIAFPFVIENIGKFLKYDEDGNLLNILQCLFVCIDISKLILVIKAIETCN